jgi:hypothetical protein
MSKKHRYKAQTRENIRAAEAVPLTPGDYVRMTKAILVAGRTGLGGWTAKQLACFDIPWPPKGGWIRRLIGQSFPRHRVERFLLLKGVDPATILPGSISVPVPARHNRHCTTDEMADMFIEELENTVCLHDAPHVGDLACCRECIKRIIRSVFMECR